MSKEVPLTPMYMEDETKECTPCESMTDNWYINQISRNISSIERCKNSQYAGIGLICYEVLESISDANVSQSSIEARRAEYAQLLKLTNELVKRDRLDSRINDIATDLVECRAPNRYVWRRLGLAILAATGALLAAAGAIALATGLGFFPGSFIASAGAWLIAKSGIALGSSLVIGVSAGATVSGTSVLAGSAYGTFRLFRPSCRENLKDSILKMTDRDPTINARM